MAEWIVEANDRDDLINGLCAIGVELVRCRDCKWSIGIEADKPLYCAYEYPNNITVDYLPVCGDGFCYRGERKDEVE